VCLRPRACRGLIVCFVSWDELGCAGADYAADLPAELIRNDIRETQAGVDLLLDVQVFDVKSCKVLPNVMVDFWHANALGVYGGYQSEGTSGDTWLRGLAETDSEGVVQITSKWPGHYGGE